MDFICLNFPMASDKISELLKQTTKQQKQNEYLLGNSRQTSVHRFKISFK